MVTADSLRIIVSSGVSFWRAAPRRHAYRAGDDLVYSAPYVAQPSARSSPVQTTCPERAMPMAWQALAGGRAAHRAALPGHRVPVPSGRGKMQGKIEGCGTKVRTKPVCTWGWRGTRQDAARCRPQAQCRDGTEEIECLHRRVAMTLYGVTV